MVSGGGGGGAGERALQDALKWSLAQQQGGGAGAGAGSGGGSASPSARAHFSSWRRLEGGLKGA